MTSAHLLLASVLVVVARWSMNLDVIFVISGVFFISRDFIPQIMERSFTREDEIK